MLEILSVFFGPIFAKELVEMSRRWRYYLGRIIYGTALFITLIAISLDHRRVWTAEGLSIREMANFAYAIFMAVSILQYAAVYIFVPVFLCGVIAGEREERTLELLFTTHLTNRQIILSKLMSRLFVVTLLILSALPVFALITLFGGVDLVSVLMNTAATLLALLLVGSVSIYMSATTKSPLGALVRTYGWLLIWLVAVPMLIGMIGDLAFRGGPAPAAIVYVGMFLPLLHPVFVFVLGMNPLMYNRIVTATGTMWYYPAAFVLPTLISCFYLWRASRRVRVEPKTFRQRLAWLGAPLRWLRRLRDPDDLRKAPRLRRRSTRWHVNNPFWQRARMVRVYDREGYIGWIQWAGWCAAILFFGLFLIADPRFLRDDESVFVFLGPTLVGLALLTTLVAASSIVGDRRRGFFELVLTTPVTPREAVDGTLLAVWQHLRPTFFLVLILEITFVLTGGSHWVGAFLSLVTIVLFGALLALVGIACSLAARTYVGALTPTFLYLIALMVGLIMMMGFLEEVSAPALWVLAAVLIVISAFAVRRWTNPVCVGLLCLSSYLAILSLATFWTWDPSSRREEFPIVLLHPGFLALRPLEGTPDRWADDLPWTAIYPFFWSGLVINFLFIRWWVISNFNRLVGRSTGQRAIKPSVSSPLQGVGERALHTEAAYSKT